MIVEAFTASSFISGNMACHFMLLCVVKETCHKCKTWNTQECVLLASAAWLTEKSMSLGVLGVKLSSAFY